MSGSDFGFYRLNMFLHVKGRLGFHAPYIGNVPQGAYDSKTVENAFSAAVLAIRKLMKLDPSRFSASFLTQMLEKGPEETFDIDTVGKVIEHKISLYGGGPPRDLAGRSFCFACFYELGAVSDCDDRILRPPEKIARGVRYTADTFRGGECVAEVRLQNARIAEWRLVKFSYETSPTLPYWFLYPSNTPISRLALETRPQAGSRLSALPPRSAAPNRLDGLDASVESRIARYIEQEYLRDLEQYAPQVDYYDKGIVDQGFIAEDKQRYARKWPQRQYRMTPGSLRISPRGPNEYSATFEFTYQVANSSKRKAGRGATQIFLRESDGQFLVAGVKEVVQR